MNFCANNYLGLSSNDEIIEAELAQEFAKKLLEQGIYVIGFFFPVVPKGKARIRVQLSAAHGLSQI